MSHIFSIDDARAAKAKALEVFNALVGQAAVGIMRVGEGYGLKVNLTTPPPADISLPETVGGVPVVVAVVGPIKKREV